MKERLTSRLLLRQWSQDDFEPFARMYGDEALSKFIGGPLDRAQAWRKMASIIGHWKLRGFGLWAVETRADACFVGAAGLWKPEGWPELEIGYWLLPEFRAQGYAAEAVIEACRCAYQELGCETVVSYIKAENRASIAVAERVGARYDGQVVLMGIEAQIWRHPAPNQG